MVDRVIKKETTEPYYECARCKLDTLSKKPDRMLPCPRGSCEAEYKGFITTETIINLTLNK